MKYEVIVVGGGHAGIEAALATARLNTKTLLITGRIGNIADMPCNPSIGGPAKGVIVREIDALGGEMGKNADKSSIQMKMLNKKKGPAVRALRTQADKIVYPKEMIKTLQNQENLEILEAMVEDLVVEDNIVKGVILEDNTIINSKVVILSTGTYLKALVLEGQNKTESGPHGEKFSKNLSSRLSELGFRLQRLKTGTPPRVRRDSVDFTKVTVEPGDNEVLNFSFDEKVNYKPDEQMDCYLTHSNLNTHEIINDNLELSSMYGGHVQGLGPRYCPSIEDKIVRFYDKEKHQIFIEPESRHYDEMYLQGLSTSMPHDVQEKMVRSVKGLENAVITKYAYAIEYDALDPSQLTKSLETKIIKNLFTAGQINGTSGYEEAAAQGIMAGINAHRKINNLDPIILNRNDAYIGVLIDDLINKGVVEPYRMLTSRAEYRLLLRHDNADLRLRNIGYEVGLISDEQKSRLDQKINDINDLINILKTNKITPKKETNKTLEKYNSSTLQDGIFLYDLLKRPEINMDIIKEFIEIDFSDEVVEQVEISTKYEGYIKKANQEAEKMLSLEYTKIPEDIDYNKIHNLASEARDKLNEVRPLSIGQASRISGVNPSDVSILSVYLKKIKEEI